MGAVQRGVVRPIIGHISFDISLLVISFPRRTSPIVRHLSREEAQTAQMINEKCQIIYDQ